MVEHLLTNPMIVDFNAVLFCVNEDDEFWMKYPSVLMKIIYSTHIENQFTFMNCGLRKIYIHL